MNAKSSGSDVEGLGFAIPINSVKDVIVQIIDHGYVKGRIDWITMVDVDDRGSQQCTCVTQQGDTVSEEDLVLQVRRQDRERGRQCVKSKSEV